MCDWNTEATRHGRVRMVLRYITVFEASTPLEVRTIRCAKAGVSGCCRTYGLIIEAYKFLRHKKANHHHKWMQIDVNFISTHHLIVTCEPFKRSWQVGDGLLDGV